jgi:MFS family permease
VLLSWLPTFFKAPPLNVDLKAQPLTTAMPYFCAMLGGLGSGRISDIILRANPSLRVWSVRRGMCVVGTMGGVACLLLTASSTTPFYASASLCLTLFFTKFICAGYWVNMLDVCPQEAGKLMAISNTLATIPGIIGQPITQWILDETDSWMVVFCVAAAIQIFGAICFLLLGSDENIEFRPRCPTNTSELSTVGSTGTGTTLCASLVDLEMVADPRQTRRVTLCP